MLVLRVPHMVLACEYDEAWRHQDSRRYRGCLGLGGKCQLEVDDDWAESKPSLEDSYNEKASKCLLGCIAKQTHQGRVDTP